jgi:hypothetical protein
MFFFVPSWESFNQKCFSLSQVGKASTKSVSLCPKLGKLQPKVFLFVPNWENLNLDYITLSRIIISEKLA